MFENGKLCEKAWSASKSAVFVQMIAVQLSKAEFWGLYSQW